MTFHVRSRRDVAYVLTAVRTGLDSGQHPERPRRADHGRRTFTAGLWRARTSGRPDQKN